MIDDKIVEKIVNYLKENGESRVYHLLEDLGVGKYDVDEAVKEGVAEEIPNMVGVSIANWVRLPGEKED